YLFTLATAAFVFWFARRLWTKNEAMIAAIVTLATPLTIAFSRTVIFDSALAFFVTVAMGCFYLSVEGESVGAGFSRPGPAEAGPYTSRTYTLLAWAAIGLGVITKGPVAIALPLLVA